jgi:hypothetical protein
MAPLRASTTKFEWLPDDPTAFAPSTPWKLPCITTWDDSQSQNRPTNSAEEADVFAFHVAGGLIHLLLIIAVISLVIHFFRGRSAA